MLIPAILLAASGLYFETGESLYRKCIAEDVRERYYCYGFVSAVSDSVVSYKSVGAHQPVCIDTKLTRQDLRDTVVAYLRANPARRPLAASDLVIIALKEAYPCGPADPD